MISRSHLGIDGAVRNHSVDTPTVVGEAHFEYVAGDLGLDQKQSIAAGLGCGHCIDETFGNGAIWHHIHHQ